MIRKSVLVTAPVLGAALMVGTIMAFPLETASAQDSSSSSSSSSSNTNTNNNNNDNSATSSSDSSSNSNVNILRGGALPDLIPVQTMAQFCERTMDGRTLIVTVRNQGGTATGPFTTQVNFDVDGTSSIQTAFFPGLGPNDSVALSFPIPSGCFNPDCGFEIIVDVNNNVIESVETNNNARGSCVG